jgi:hypothetical protein
MHVHLDSLSGDELWGWAVSGAQRARVVNGAPVVDGIEDLGRRPPFHAAWRAHEQRETWRRTIIRALCRMTAGRSWRARAVRQPSPNEPSQSLDSEC